MPLMLGELLLYDRALNYEAPRSRRGEKRAAPTHSPYCRRSLRNGRDSHGRAVTVKFNSVVVLFAVAVHWTIVRRQGREHLHLFASAAVIIVGYITTMLLLEGPEFVRQNTAQFDRSTGTYASRGTVGLDVAVRAFTHNYALYVGTLLVVMYAVALIAARLFGALRRRSWARLRGPDSLYLAWSIASIVFLGALSLEISPLHDPHADPDLSLRGKSHCGLDARISLSLAPNSPPRRRRGPLVGECRRVPGTDSPRPRNEIGQASAYVAELPRRAIVLADEPIGVSIPQRYLNIDQWVLGDEAIRPDYVAAGNRSAGVRAPAVARRSAPWRARQPAGLL